MPDPRFQTLETLLANDGDYVRLCEIAGALMQSDPQGLEQWLLPKAQQLLPITASNHANAPSLQKCAMVLGFLAAHVNDASQQQEILSRTLLLLLNQTEDPFTRTVIVSELTYLDQYLASSVRQTLLATLRDLPLSLHTASIRDYLQAWKDQANLAGLLDVVGAPASQGTLNVYLVCSAKGGVGKSITALALLNMLAERNNGKAKTAIIDLDTSGPTLPFTLDVPAVAGAHGLVPCDSPPSPSPQWQYWTFFDTLRTAHHINPAEPEDLTELMATAQASILSVSNLRGVSAVLLPDSPTYAAHAASYWDAQVLRSVNLQALAATFNQLAATGHRDVVLDCRPGLWGANGFMLHWVSVHFPTCLLVLSSPNATDLGTTLYESLWIAAAGLCRWRCPPLFLANMWRPGKGCPESMETWANLYVNAAIKASINKTAGTATSACQIYSSRMWCYLYWKTLKNSASLQIHSLRDEPILRTILDADALVASGFPWDKVADTDWYKHDLRDALAVLWQVRA